MQRTTTAVLVALLVIGTLAAVPVAMAQQSETEQTAQSAGNDTVAPGEQLTGVIGVGEAEIDGEVESRAYGIRVADANSSDAKAAVVADQLNRTEQRLAELEDRKAKLQAARENGSISEGQYRARIATLHAESQSVSRLANQTNETAGELPAETLEANGVNVTAIRSLQDRSANLSGPETAAIAQSIAGENARQTARPEEANGSDAADRSGSDRAGPANATTETTDDSTATNETSRGSTDGTDSGSPSDYGQQTDSSAGTEETTTIADSN